MKISLRDLFWLVLVAGMGCAWWVEYKQEMARYEQLAQECQDWKDRADLVATTWAMQGGPQYDWGEVEHKEYAPRPKGLAGRR